MALGARANDVVRLFTAEGLPLAGIGLALGLALALARVVSPLLYGVAPYDTPTLAAVAAVLLAVAGLAALLPARHASKLDPAVALREE